MSRRDSPRYRPADRRPHWPPWLHGALTAVDEAPASSLVDLTLAWDANPPICPLRVGAYRVQSTRSTKTRRKSTCAAAREKPPRQADGGCSMKTISVRDLRKRIRSEIETAQNDQVVITRNGQPIAVVVGVEGADWETVAVETSRSFWKEIARRRDQETISLAEVRERLRGIATQRTVRMQFAARSLDRRIAMSTPDPPIQPQANHPHLRRPTALPA